MPGIVEETSRHIATSRALSCMAGISEISETSRIISIGRRLARLVDMQNIVTVNILVESLSLDVLRDTPDLLDRPPIDPGEGSHAQSLNALRDGKVIPTSNLLFVFIVMPRVQGQSHHLVIDLGEASFLQIANRFARAVGDGPHG